VIPVSDAVPPWAYEKPELHPHDPELPARAAAERERLLELLAPWLADGVQHVGSTAVPGLAAKPVIDLMASVHDLDIASEQAGGPLAADGWCYVPPSLDSGASWRRFFVKPDASGQHRYAHLHVIQAGHSPGGGPPRRSRGLHGRQGQLRRGRAPALEAAGRDLISNGLPSWHHGGVEIAEHIDALERDGVLLADAAQEAGLAAAVPSCPGWQVRDLVRHQAYVHDWAVRHVRDQASQIIDDGITEADLLGAGPADAELVAAYRTGHAGLVRVLRDADPDLACATFMAAPSPLAFWARREAHETAIHRFDAQAARPGGPPGAGVAFDPAFANDGIDELIMGFAAWRRHWLRGDGTRSLAIRAADTTGRWHIRLADGTTEVGRGDATADCVLEGPAAGLYAFLWNRSDTAAATIAITGAPGILNDWSSSVCVTWSRGPARPGAVENTLPHGARRGIVWA
jgi:uncharacterized protein (TIGR03083 family)